MAAKTVDREFALLAIHPKYVDAIVEGKKRVEFRKTMFKKPVTDIVVYATAPIKLIVCHFRIESITIDEVDRLWDAYHNIGGIEFGEFFRYFSDNKIGVAIEIGNLSLLKKPFPIWKLDNNITAPQSFVYLTGNQFNNINRRKLVS